MRVFLMQMMERKSCEKKRENHFYNQKKKEKEL